MRKVLIECEKCGDRFKIDMAILRGIGYFWKCSKCGWQQYYKAIAEPGPGLKYRMPIGSKKS